MKKALALLILVVLISNHVYAIPPEVPGVVKGFVTDAQTDATIYGAAVNVSSQYTLKSATTSRQGSYKVRVPSGTYNIRVSAPGYITRTIENVSVSSGSYARMHFHLVSEMNNPPTASIISPSEGSVHTLGFKIGDIYYKLGNSVAFNGSGTDSDGTIASYAWTSNIDGVLSSTDSFSTSDLSIGTHVITFTVTDNHGATGTAEVTIRINNPPIASILSPINGSVYSQRDSTTFNGTGTDADGTIASYAWTSSLEDVIGNDSFSSFSLHVGIHTITLTVTDNDGANGTAEVTINQTEYDVEWLLKRTTSWPGSTVPIKFTVHSPITGEFVVDKTVVVKVYDPDTNEVFRATYAEEGSGRKDTGVRIDVEGEHYITNFHSSKDAPTGTYTIKVEFASNRPNTNFETMLEIHTPPSKWISRAKNIINTIFKIRHR